MYARILTVALLAIGCAEVSASEPAPVDPTHAHYTLSDELETEHVEAFLQAAEAWRVATKGRVWLTFELGPVVPGTAWTIAPGASMPDNVGARTLEGRNAIVINVAEIPPSCVWLVAAHELGHTFGIDHGAAGVMRARHGRTCESRSLTADDVALFDAAVE